MWLQHVVTKFPTYSITSHCGGSAWQNMQHVRALSAWLVPMTSDCHC